MTDLLSELEAVVGLAGKATPGPWHRHTDCPGMCCWHMFHSEDGIYGPEPAGQEPSLINSPEMSEENATYIVALNNFIRTHHAEIAAAVRDAKFLKVAEVTLYQIATTPRNAGARRNANATMRFIETQRAAAMRAGEGEG